MKLDHQLHEKIIQFIFQRFGDDPWVVASGAYTLGQKILFSTAPYEHFKTGQGPLGSLVHEAFKYSEGISACMTLKKDNQGSFEIVVPNGHELDKLQFFGPSVEVAIPLGGDLSKYSIKSLKEIAPYLFFE